MNEKIKQLAIDAQIQMVSEERLMEFARLIIAECMYICEDVALEAFGTANSTFVTDMGKDVHMAMGMGAKNCAVYIHNEFYGDREVCDCGEEHK